MPKLEIRGRLDVDLVDSDALDDAFVFDHGKRQKALGDGKVRIRLEGIEVPELHYPTTETTPR